MESQNVNTSNMVNDNKLTWIIVGYFVLCLLYAGSRGLGTKRNRRKYLKIYRIALIKAALPIYRFPRIANSHALAPPIS